MLVSTGLSQNKRKERRGCWICSITHSFKHFLRKLSWNLWARDISTIIVFWFMALWLVHFKFYSHHINSYWKGNRKRQLLSSHKAEWSCWSPETKSVVTHHKPVELFCWLMVFYVISLRRIFVRNRVKVAGGWRMRNFITCTLHQISVRWSNQGEWNGPGHIARIGDEKCVQNFSGQIWRVEITWET
jgi:hypothetical protein